MNTTIKTIMERLEGLGDDDIAAHSRRFFKTGPGQYGEGDRFWGIRVPVIRKCAKQLGQLALEDILTLLTSPFHEARHLALFVLVARYAKASSAGEHRTIYRAYLNNTRYINNWDLVDCSAEHIVGAYLLARNRRPLFRLAGAESLWERRISVLATFHFIKRQDFTDTLALAKSLLSDQEDLIHKAVGWMLREIGKRDKACEEDFLDKHYRQMPRTMLRYAIEKLPERERQAYLNGTR
jgi:3-methyladenine DNA glycosylase AlkD